MNTSQPPQSGQPQPTEQIESSGVLLTVADALADADSFVVSHNMLGWLLTPIGGDFSLLISQVDALRIIREQQRTQPATLPGLQEQRNHEVIVWHEQAKMKVYVRDEAEAKRFITFVKAGITGVNA